MSAQENFHIEVQSYDIGDGISHEAVQNVFQDREGIIWISTSNGLDRFDGYEFQTWNAQDLRLKRVIIESIGQDNDGWIWLKNNAGQKKWQLRFINPKTLEILTESERFGDDFPIVLNSDLPSCWATPNTTDLLNKTSDGSLLFGTDNPPIRLTSFNKSDGFKSIDLPQLDQFLVHHSDDLGNIYGSEHASIVKIDSLGNVLMKIENPEYNSVNWIKEIDGDIYYEIYKYEDFIKYGNHLFVVDEGSTAPRELYKSEAENKYVEFIYHPLLDKIVAWESQNIFILDRENGEVLQSKPLPMIDPSSRLKHIDQEGRIWCSSDKNLFKILIKPLKFKTYFSFSGEGEKPMKNSARGITSVGNELVANFEMGGLLYINKSTGNWEIGGRIHSGASKWYEGYWGRSLFEDRQGLLWIGHRNLIEAWSKEKKLVKEIYFDAKIENLIECWSFFEDKNGTLWFGSDKGLGRLNDQRDSMFLIKKENRTLFDEARIYFMLDHETEDQIWICTNFGLYLYDTKANKVVHHHHSGDQGAYYLPSDYIMHMHIDDNNVYWLASRNGLIKWSYPAQEFTIYSRDSGFIDNIIYAVYEDNYEHLWMGTNQGIVQFDKKSSTVTNYLVDDGISHNEFNRTAHYRDEDGNIYFGSLNGITSFHPDNFYPKQVKKMPNLVIRNCFQFVGYENKLINKTATIRNEQEIRMEPDDSFFQIDLALLSYENTSHTVYYKQIEGVDPDWVKLEGATFQQGRLPFGSHNLSLRALNPAGNFSDQALNVKIIMIRPFYAKGWFILLCIISVLTGARFFHSYRSKKLVERAKALEYEVSKATQQIRDDKNIIEEQANELKRQDKAKTHFYTNISHELRTPLTLMLAPIKSVLNKQQLHSRDEKMLKSAYRNGKNLLTLINSILALTKSQRTSLEKVLTSVNLFEFIHDLVNNFESFASQQRVMYTFNFKAGKVLWIEVDAPKLAIVINNLLSNAFKFTNPGGRIDVEVFDNKSEIVISVQDNGRGISEHDLPRIFDQYYQAANHQKISEGGTGIGLALTKEYIKIMDGRIEVESSVGIGSTFNVYLPRVEVLSSPTNKEKSNIETNKAEIIAGVQADEKNTDNNLNHQLPKLLIVEDNHDLRSFLVTILTEDYHIEQAINGQEAWDKIQGTGHFDMILSDIMMPVMDGFQLLTLVKNHPTYSSIPMIMLTAKADKEDRLSALRIGVDDYIIKPFEEKELLTRMKLLSDNSKTRGNEFDLQSKGEIKDFKEYNNLGQNDQRWLEELEEIILMHHLDNQFNMDFVAQKMGLSRRQVQRRVKRLVGLTPSAYITNIKLHIAREFLETRQVQSVKELSNKVGYNDPSYFSRLFERHFGRTPSSYFGDDSSI